MCFVNEQAPAVAACQMPRAQRRLRKIKAARAEGSDNESGVDLTRRV